MTAWILACFKNINFFLYSGGLTPASGKALTPTDVLYSKGWGSELKWQKQEKIMGGDKCELISKKTSKTKENTAPQ